MYKKTVYFAICSILMMLVAGCSILDLPSSSADDLSLWIGSYHFGEGDSSHHSRDYNLNIYQQDDKYYADLTINGWLSGMLGKAILEGNGESVDIIFLEYPAEGGATGELQFQQGDVLLKLKMEDQTILTEWVKLEPYFIYEDGICFERKPIDSKN